MRHKWTVKVRKRRAAGTNGLLLGYFLIYWRSFQRIKKKKNTLKNRDQYIEKSYLHHTGVCGQEIVSSLIVLRMKCDHVRFWSEYETCL